MGDVPHGLTQQLVFGVSEQIAQLLIDIDQHALEIDAHDAHRGLLESFPQAPLARATLGFRLPVLHANAQVGDPEADVIGKIAEQRKLVVIECFRFRGVENQYAADAFGRFQRKRDRRLISELNGAGAFSTVGRVLQDVPRDADFSALHGLAGEPEINAFSRPVDR